MKTRLTYVLIAAGALWCAVSSAEAFPPYGPPPFYGPYYGPRPFLPRYGYGPYGFRHGLPNGTGYRGRGTFTGGPVGGLPNRN